MGLLIFLDASLIIRLVNSFKQFYSVRWCWKQPTDFNFRAAFNVVIVFIRMDP